MPQDLLATDYRYLTGEEASEFCDGYGTPVNSTTLTKLRCTGGGPLFVKFGRSVRYREDWLEDWLRAKLSAPRRSTSQVAEDPPPMAPLEGAEPARDATFGPPMLGHHADGIEKPSDIVRHNKARSRDRDRPARRRRSLKADLQEIEEHYAPPHGSAGGA